MTLVITYWFSNHGSSHDNSKLHQSYHLNLYVIWQFDSFIYMTSKIRSDLDGVQKHMHGSKKSVQALGSESIIREQDEL